MNTQSPSPPPAPRSGSGVSLSYAPPGAKKRWAIKPVEILVIIGLVAFLISILLPATNNAPWFGKWLLCQERMESIGKALRSYAEAHDGQFPDRLEDIVLSGDASTVDVFVCPSTSDCAPAGTTPAERAADLRRRGHCSYMYMGKGLTLDSPRTMPLLCELTAAHGRDKPTGGNVLYLDGHCQFVRSPVFEQIARRQATTRPEDDCP